MPLSAGTRLGSYELIAAIGAGGMGEVYRARDTRLDRDVAIKVLPADRLTDEHRRLRFVQEAKSASALNHPHIVTIHEIESHGDIDFIVMEYVRGRSLDAVIPRQGPPAASMLSISRPTSALRELPRRAAVDADRPDAPATAGAGFIGNSIQPVTGGQPREVIPCVRELAFAVRPSVIYYAACGPGRSRPLRVFDRRTGQTRDLGILTDVFRMAGGNRVAVSPDGKTILVHRESFTSDLMMIENFRWLFDSAPFDFAQSQCVYFLAGKIRSRKARTASC
jgi:hypothetical protein